MLNFNQMPTHAYTKHVNQQRTLNNDRLYADAQSFVEDCYSSAFGARIICDYPQLMVMTDNDSNPLAVVGIRTPDEPFFLEHYLDHCAENVLSDIYQTSIPRHSIVEIGNLVSCSNPASTSKLMHQLWHYLINAGYEHLMMTSTQQLCRRFRNLPLQEICVAEKSNVAASSNWGSYYDNSPRVLAGELGEYDNRFDRSVVCSSEFIQLAFRKEVYQ